MRVLYDWLRLYFLSKQGHLSGNLHDPPLTSKFSLFHTVRWAVRRCSNCGLPLQWVEMRSWNNYFLVLFSAEVSGGGVHHAERCDVAPLVWPTPAVYPSLKHWRVSVSVCVCKVICIYATHVSKCKQVTIRVCPLSVCVFVYVCVCVCDLDWECKHTVLPHWKHTSVCVLFSLGSCKPTNTFVGFKLFWTERLVHTQTDTHTHTHTHTSYLSC